jgi:three-Cys-motif partner protein
MAKKNDDFFKEKKPWSEVKDELLGCYFKPYVSKILHTYKPLVYVDCFAGKGKFDDGQSGSPLIALNIINECMDKTKMNTTLQISTNFIDLNYAADLHKNLKDYPGVNIISGKYEEKIEELLSSKKGCNVFLYIDPYGIKALQCSLFDSFAMGRFNSIELLINMNSFGFVREACHAFGTTYNDVSVFEDLIEYDSTRMDASEKSITELNEIAGGDYWQSIIENYKNHKIDGYEAESLFSEQYCSRLKQSYSYVLNMPLRIKKGQRPKYRLIHATNHKNGCLLMVDNICNRWQALQEIQTCGQLKLWEENYENQIVDDEDIEKKIIEHLSQFRNRISLYETLAAFFIKHGAICSTSAVKKIIKRLEKENRIEIIRNPATTERGKPTTFMDEGKGKTITVRWLK